MPKTDETDAAFTDAKGRALPEYMTDREMMVAILNNQRAMMDMVNDLFDSMRSNPMFRAMMGGKK